MPYKAVFQISSRVVFAAAILWILAAAILTSRPKALDEFDQPFYLTVAYDLIHHGVFSNGSINLENGTGAVPAPGMFFGPAYPALIAIVAQVDERFAKAVDCAAVTYVATRRAAGCDAYVRPMLVVHAFMLAIGVLAIARAAELLFQGAAVFWLTGVLATGALLADADQFSFLMTESTVFSLYSLAMLAITSGWASSRRAHFAVGGVAFGVLCLARFSFLVAAAVIPALILVNVRYLARRGWDLAGASAFVLAFMAAVLPWAARNAISVGKFALAEEYGSVTLVERFAYDQMTLREFFLAFPHCLPQVGQGFVRHSFGAEAMRRFQYDLPNSFYAIGVARRDALTKEFTRIDPIILDVMRAEMTENWWRYLLVSVPLAWCGMWVGGWLGLALVPFFAVGCVAAYRQSKPLILLYAAPALVMLALHALLASFYTRYNLALIGPFSAASAWLIGSIAMRLYLQMPTFLSGTKDPALNMAVRLCRASSLKIRGLPIEPVKENP
jgi:hypothetical protein